MNQKSEFSKTNAIGSVKPVNVSSRNCGSDSKMDLGSDLDEEFYGGHYSADKIL